MLLIVTVDCVDKLEGMLYKKLEGLIKVWFKLIC